MSIVFHDDPFPWQTLLISLEGQINKRTTLFDEILSRALRDFSQGWQYSNVGVWFQKCYLTDMRFTSNESCSLLRFVARLRFGPSLCERIEPFSSMLEKVAEEFVKELQTPIVELLSSFKSPKHIEALLACDFNKSYYLIKQRCNEYDLLALEIVRKAAEEEERRAKQRWKQMKISQSSGCLIPLAIGGGLILLALL